MGTELDVFPARRTTRWQNWNPDASQGQRFFRGDNPPSGAIINYYLAEAPAEGRGPDAGVKIRVDDADGNLVREWTERERVAGVNRANWNLSHEGPAPVALRSLGPERLLPPLRWWRPAGTAPAPTP